LGISSVLVLAGLAAGCGGSVVPPPDPLDVIGLRLEQNEVCVGADSRTVVTVHLSRGTAPRNDVTVTVDGDPDEMLVEPLVIPADQDDGELSILTGTPVKSGTVTLHVHAGAFTTALDVLVGGPVGSVDRSFGVDGTLTASFDSMVFGVSLTPQGSAMVMAVVEEKAVTLSRIDEHGTIDAKWGDKGRAVLAPEHGVAQVATGADRSIWVTPSGISTLRLATRISPDGSTLTPVMLPALGDIFHPHCIVATPVGMFVGGWLSNGGTGIVFKVMPNLTFDIPYTNRRPPYLGEVQDCAAVTDSKIDVALRYGSIVQFDETGTVKSKFGPLTPIGAIAHDTDGLTYTTTLEVVPPATDTTTVLHVYDSSGQLLSAEDATWPISQRGGLLVTRDHSVLALYDKALLRKRRGSPIRAIGGMQPREVVAVDACGRVVAAYTPYLYGTSVQLTRLWL
jgi:hypothetical protein